MSSGLSPELDVYSATAKKSSSISLFTSRFSAIPPERVGLNGEYDHHGLVKRVMLAFSQEFHPDELAELKIRQRGAVVILMGKVSNRRLLARMIQTALRVNGATDVETYGVGIEPNRESQRELNRELTQPLPNGLRLMDFANGA